MLQLRSVLLCHQPFVEACTQAAYHDPRLIPVALAFKLALKLAQAEESDVWVVLVTSQHGNLQFAWCL